MSNDDHVGTRRTGLIGWASRHPRMTVVLGSLLALVLVTLLIDRGVDQRLRQEIAAIKARGEPTTVEDINRTISNTPLDRNPAFMILDRTAFLLGPAKFPGEPENMPHIGSARPVITGTPLPPNQSEALRLYFSARMGDLWVKDKSEVRREESYPDDATVSDVLRELYQILALPGGRYERQFTTPAVLTTLPELSRYRGIAQLLACAADYHAESADLPACGDDLQAMFRLNEMLDCKYPPLIQVLVQMAMETLYVEQIERAINRCGLAPTDLETNQRRLTDIQNGLNLKGAMMVERVCFIDTYNWVKSGAGSIGTVAGLSMAGPVLPSNPNIWQYIPILPSLDAAYGLEGLGLCVEAACSADPDSISKAKMADSRLASAPSYAIFSSSMLPSLSRSIELQFKSVGSKRTMIAALACERYRLANSDWPESLTDLVPEYLKAVPNDPFDEAPIRYAVTPEGIKLWCIGEDLKDDGGDIKRREKLTTLNQPSDWGWLILNPNLRGKPLPARDTAAEVPATQGAAKQSGG